MAEESSDNGKVDVFGEGYLRVSKWSRGIGRPLRVLMTNNLGYNAWKNAKLLQSEFVSVDVVCSGFRRKEYLPEFVETNIYGTGSLGLNLDLSLEAFETGGGFRRPVWFVQGPTKTSLEFLKARAVGNEDAAKMAYLVNEAARYDELMGTQKPTPPEVFSYRAAGVNMCAPSARKTAASPISFDERIDQLKAEHGKLFPDRKDAFVPEFYKSWRGEYRRWVEVIAGYDVVMGIASSSTPFLLAGSVPFIAYSIGTLRELPFLDDGLGRNVALQYCLADEVVITNPDTRPSADALNIQRYRFIPHAISEHCYETTVPNPVPRSVGRYLFMGSRQDWQVKKSQVAFTAFAELSKKYPDLGLVAVEWGSDIDRSKDLVAELGIDSKVTWINFLPLRESIAAIEGAEVAIDQFADPILGVFGPETMAVGTPCVSYLTRDALEWCLPEMPPIFLAHDHESAVEAMERALRVDREDHKRKTQSWMTRYYSSKVVVEQHLKLFADVMNME